MSNKDYLFNFTFKIETETDDKKYDFSGSYKSLTSKTDYFESILKIEDVKKQIIDFETSIIIPKGVSFESFSTYWDFIGGGIDNLKTIPKKDLSLLDNYFGTKWYLNSLFDTFISLNLGSEIEKYVLNKRKEYYPELKYETVHILKEDKKQFNLEGKEVSLTAMEKPLKGDRTILYVIDFPENIKRFVDGKTVGKEQVSDIGIYMDISNQYQNAIHHEVEGFVDVFFHSEGGTPETTWFSSLTTDFRYFEDIIFNHPNLIQRFFPQQIE